MASSKTLSDLLSICNCVPKKGFYHRSCPFDIDEHFLHIIIISWSLSHKVHDHNKSLKSRHWLHANIIFLPQPPTNQEWHDNAISRLQITQMGCCLSSRRSLMSIISTKKPCPCFKYYQQRKKNTRIFRPPRCGSRHRNNGALRRTTAEMELQVSTEMRWATFSNVDYSVN